MSESGPGGSQLLLPAGKPLLILAYLVAQADRGASREFLTTLGWGDRDDGHARASLRQTLYRLRQLLGRDALAEEGATIRLQASIPSDWGAATAAVAHGDDAALLGIVRGRFLDGIEAPDDSAGNGWLPGERMRWERQQREVAIRLGRQSLLAGRVDEAIDLAERGLTATGDHLGAWTLYLDALCATGIVTRIEDGLARLEAAGEHGVLGSAEPQGWRLLARRVRRGLDRGTAESDATAAEPGLLPFTGRSLLLAHLQLLLRLPAHERRRMIVLAASAGFGKSRLLRELRLRHAASLGTMVSVDTRSGDATTPLALLNRVVEAVAALPEALGIDPEAAAVLVAANPRLADRFDGLDRTAPAVPSIAALADAVAELVSAVSEHQPLLLAVDDAQWGDEASLALLTATFSGDGTGAAVCLLATRDLPAAVAPQRHTLHLPSLTSEDLATLVASELPMLPLAQHAEAASALLLVTGGVPIYVMRALQRLNALVRDGTSRDDLLAVIPELVLHRDPAFPTGDVDRRLLGYLAIAGGTVDEDELGALSEMGSAAALRDRLGHLERSGWVVRRGTGHQLTHDLVLQQALEGLSPTEHRHLALQHSRWLSLHGDALHDLQRAVRVSLSYDDAAQAVRAVRDWRRRVRGGPRGRALASLVLPPDTPRGTWWRVSAAATPSMLRLVSIAAVALSIIGGALLGWLRQPASLRLENDPRVPGVDASNPGRVRRNIEAPIFTVRDRLGRLSMAMDGKELRIVGWSDPVDSARLERPDVVKDGLVAANDLVVYGGLQDPLGVSFRVGDLPKLAVTVFRGFESQALAIEGGIINGRPVSTSRPEIMVAPGDSLLGFVRLRYTTPSQAALWMLAASSTMRPAIEDTLTVITLHAGAMGAVTEPFVQRRAPSTPGVYWLIWAFAAEKDAVSILSLTNWRCGAPHWNDGNDLATVPDSALRSVWGGGALSVDRDLCEQGEPPSRKHTVFPAAVMRVVVK